MAESEMRYWVGLDLGQAADYSALAVLERKLEPVGDPYDAQTLEATPPHRLRPVIRQDVRCVYHVRHMARPPLRTPYTDVAEGVVERIRKIAPVGPFGKDRPTVGLIVDATGVGRGVVDIIHRKITRDLDPRHDPKIALLPAVITGGFKTTRDEAGFFHVPKRELIFTGGVIPLQDGRLQWGRRINERETLEQELAGYNKKVNIASGHMSFEPWREGEHDDLLFALCLAAWAWERRKVKHQDTPRGLDDAPRGPLTGAPYPPVAV